MEKKIRWIRRRSQTPGCFPRAAVLCCQLSTAIQAPPSTGPPPGWTGRETQEAEKEPAPCSAHGRKPAGEVCSRQPWQPAPAAAPTCGKHCLRWSGRPPPGVGAVDSRSFPVPTHPVACAHSCALSVHRAPACTVGTGASEPDLSFLKRSLIAFCNCTVEKCSRSP